MGKKPTKFYSSLAEKIFERDGGKCIYCGDYAGEIDHVIPACDGGPNIRSNGVSCCKRCNHIKRRRGECERFLSRAIFWLMEKGEDIEWMDKHYE